MKNTKFKHHNRLMLDKIDKVVAETIIHKRPFSMDYGVWHFVVLGPDGNGKTAIRTGSAEQARIRQAPVYIATLGGPHIAEGEGMPIEELAGGDVPEELAGLKVFNLSPLRPLSVTAQRAGPPLEKALDEVMELYQGNETAIIETPDQAYWALSVLKYLDESDRIFPDPLMTRFFGHPGTGDRGLPH